MNPFLCSVYVLNAETLCTETKGASVIAPPSPSYPVAQVCLCYGAWTFFLLCLLWASDLCIKAWLQMKQWWWRSHPLWQCFSLNPEKKTQQGRWRENGFSLFYKNEIRALSILTGQMCRETWKVKLTRFLLALIWSKMIGWESKSTKQENLYQIYKGWYYLPSEWRHFRHHRFEMETKRKIYSWDIHFLLAVVLFLLSPIRWITGEYNPNLVNNDKYATYLNLTRRKRVRKHLVYLMKQENTNFIRSCCFPIDNCGGSCLRSDIDIINEQ